MPIEGHYFIDNKWYSKRRNRIKPKRTKADDHLWETCIENIRDIEPEDHIRADEIMYKLREDGLILEVELLLYADGNHKDCFVNGRQIRNSIFPIRVYISDMDSALFWNYKQRKLAKTTEVWWELRLKLDKSDNSLEEFRVGQARSKVDPVARQDTLDYLKERFDVTLKEDTSVTWRALEEVKHDW